LPNLKRKEKVVKSLRLISLPLAAFAMMAMLTDCGGTNKPTALGPGLDTTPPPAPNSLALSHDEMGRAIITWEASAAPDVVGYQVYVCSPAPERVDGYVLANDPETRDTTFLLPSDAQGVYRVRAVDAAGNTSAFSAAVTVPFTSDGDRTPIDIP
jgi:hypothetical protein